MSFWEDLSSATKGYLVIATLLIVGLLAFRACASGDDQAAPLPRGYQAR